MKKKLYLLLFFLLLFSSFALFIHFKYPVNNIYKVSATPTETPEIYESSDILPTRGLLTYYKKVKTFSTNDSKIILCKSSSGADAIAWANTVLGPPQYSVKAYQVKYWSIRFNKQMVLVSGAVLIPQGVDTAMPLYVFQHATILSNNQSPSDIEKSKETQTLAAVIASHGNIVAMTDYVGDGLCASPDNHDEYLCAQSEAYNGVDILTATHHMLDMLNISTNGKLFVSGYSEGGQAASALARLLQSNYPQYPVTAAAFMEGPYSMTAELNYLLRPPGVDLTMDGINLHVGSIICGKAVYALNNIYHWTNSMNEIFLNPYDKQVENDFSTSNASILDLLLDFEQNTSSIIKLEFLSRILSGDVAVDIAENNTYEWVPKMPVISLSSPVDTLIPWDAQQPFYQIMKKAATNNVSMELTPFNLNHLENLLPALVKASQFFQKYQ